MSDSNEDSMDPTTADNYTYQRQQLVSFNTATNEIQDRPTTNASTR